MAKMSSRSNTPRVPCALRNYLRKNGLSISLADLSHFECQIAFQHWVAYDRNASPGICEEERLMCPLLWCREPFDDLLSCQQHLLTCPWLTDSWYWCPSCHRPERFRASSVTSLVLGKASRLKRAVSFFKHFGRKSSTRTKGSVSCFELGDHFHCCLPELQTTEPASMMRSAQDLNVRPWESGNKWSRVPREKGIDLDDCHGESMVTSHNGQSAKVNNAKPIYDPVQLCGTPVVELPAYHPAGRPDFPEMSASNIACPDSTHVIYGNKSAVSPLSQPNSPDNVSTIRSDSVSLMSLHFPKQLTAHNPPPSIMTPIVATDRKSNTAVYAYGCVRSTRGLDHHQNRVCQRGNISDLSLPFSCLGKTIKDGNLTTAEASVEDLGGIVCALHQVWMQKLTANMGEPMKAKVSQCSPFETGIRVLRKYWEGGHLPKVFEEAFALMHIAFACAWIYHRDDTLAFWNSFVQDVFKWHHVLLTREDKVFFLKAADLIWSLPEPLSVEAMFPSALLHWSQPVTPFELEGNAPTQAFYQQRLPPHELHPPSSQLEPSIGPTDVAFRQGAVIRVCSRYLDNIEYLNVCERNAAHMSQWSRVSQAPSNFQDIKTYMIDPLMQRHDLDDFRDHIIETESFLHRGLLHTPREVELRLAFVSQLSNRSASLYEKYRAIIASLCDELMFQSDSSWRDLRYQENLKQVLAISQTKPHSGNLHVDTKPRLDTALAVADQQRLYHESPSSAHSHKSSTSINSTTTAPTPSTIPGSSGSPSNDDEFIFTPEVSPSSSPVELPAPDSSSLRAPSTAKKTLSRCEICKTTFSGSKRDRSSNLRRHMRDIHRQRSRLPCPEEDCDRSYSRSDNLLKHRRASHGFV